MKCGSRPAMFVSARTKLCWISICWKLVGGGEKRLKKSHYSLPLTPTAWYNLVWRQEAARTRVHLITRTNNSLSLSQSQSKDIHSFEVREMSFGKFRRVKNPAVVSSRPGVPTVPADRDQSSRSCLQYNNPIESQKPNLVHMSLVQNTKSKILIFYMMEINISGWSPVPAVPYSPQHKSCSAGRLNLQQRQQYRRRRLPAAAAQRWVSSSGFIWI